VTPDDGIDLAPAGACSTQAGSSSGKSHSAEAAQQAELRHSATPGDVSDNLAPADACSTPAGPTSQSTVADAQERRAEQAFPAAACGTLADSSSSVQGRAAEAAQLAALPRSTMPDFATYGACSTLAGSNTGFQSTAAEAAQPRANPATLNAASIDYVTDWAYSAQTAASSSSVQGTDAIAAKVRTTVQAYEGLHVTNIEPGARPNAAPWFYVQPAYCGTLHTSGVSRLGQSDEGICIFVGDCLVRASVCKVDRAGKVGLSFKGDVQGKVAFLFPDVQLSRQQLPPAIASLAACAVQNGAACVLICWPLEDVRIDEIGARLSTPINAPADSLQQRFAAVIGAVPVAILTHKQSAKIVNAFTQQKLPLELYTLSIPSETRSYRHGMLTIGGFEPRPPPSASPARAAGGIGRRFMSYAGAMVGDARDVLLGKPFLSIAIAKQLEEPVSDQQRAALVDLLLTRDASHRVDVEEICALLRRRCNESPAEFAWLAVVAGLLCEAGAGPSFAALQAEIIRSKVVDGSWRVLAPSEPLAWRHLGDGALLDRVRAPLISGNVDHWATTSAHVLSVMAMLQLLDLWLGSRPVAVRERWRFFCVWLTRHPEPVGDVLTHISEHLAARQPDVLQTVAFTEDTLLLIIKPLAPRLVSVAQLTQLCTLGNSNVPPSMRVLTTAHHHGAVRTAVHRAFQQLATPTFESDLVFALCDFLSLLPGSQPAAVPVLHGIVEHAAFNLDNGFAPLQILQDCVLRMGPRWYWASLLQASIKGIFFQRHMQLSANQLLQWLRTPCFSDLQAPSINQLFERINNVHSFRLDWPQLLELIAGVASLLETRKERLASTLSSLVRRRLQTHSASENWRQLMAFLRAFSKCAHDGPVADLLLQYSSGLASTLDQITTSSFF